MIGVIDWILIVLTSLGVMLMERTKGKVKLASFLIEAAGFGTLVAFALFNTFDWLINPEILSFLNILPSTISLLEVIFVFIALLGLIIAVNANEPGIQIIGWMITLLPMMLFVFSNMWTALIALS